MGLFLVDLKTLLALQPDDGATDDEETGLQALIEPHLLPLETFDHIPIEIECTGAVRRPPADCLLNAPGSEQVLLMQLSVELDESALPSPSEARRSILQVSTPQRLIVPSQLP